MSDKTKNSLQENGQALNAHILSASTSLNPFMGTPEARANSTALGRWVFDHQRSFSPDNPLAWYGIRNVLNNMIGIVGLMATIVPVRMGMGRIARWANGKAEVLEKTGASAGKSYRFVQQFFSNAILQNILGVGVSFATFRAMYKMGQRAYDRVFLKPDSPDQTTQAIHDVPKNLLEDFKQIAPAEYPATMAAAAALVGIRFAITPRGWEQKQNIVKDTMGCALLAYPAFFEITDRLGESFQLMRGYKTKDTNEHLDRHKMSLNEFLTRQVPGVAAGIIPYIAVNNLWYRKTGRQYSFSNSQIERGIKEVDPYWKAFWKERPYQVFWMFSLGRDLYFDLYDKVTGRDKQAAAAGQKDYERMAHPSRTEETAPAGPAMAAGPRPQAGQVQHYGVVADVQLERSNNALSA